VRLPSVEQRKTWRFRLYPTASQRARLDGHLRLCCELYNAAVQERRDAWRSGRVSIGFRPQSAQLPEVKTERPDVAGVYSQVLQDVLHRVDRAFGGFFARVRRGDRPGVPRFRSAHRFDSLTYPQLGFHVHGRHLGRWSLILDGPDLRDVRLRPEAPEPTLASVSGVWALGRSGSCGCAAHSRARTAPSRRNVAPTPCVS
jgi:transposase